MAATPPPSGFRGEPLDGHSVVLVTADDKHFVVEAGSKK